MKLPISQRLLACCQFVRKGDRVADIGTDHGYLSIYLLTHCIARSVIAADVAPQPLENARRNAKKFGVAQAMTCYLSDGVRQIPRDFDVMVCAGMGADTICHILETAPWLEDPRYRLILQCQSHRPELRAWLAQRGYRILRETLAQDGKFLYPVMEVTYAPGMTLTPGQRHLSPALLEDRSPLLPAFYDRVVDGLRRTVEGLHLATDPAETEKLPDYEAALAELTALEGQIYGYCS